VLDQLVAVLAGRAVDLVFSDMAPNLSGIADTDAARVEHLVELAIDFARSHLRPNGALVCKVFHGGGYDPWCRPFAAASGWSRRTSQRRRVTDRLKPFWLESV
jgi:23S rRNA (uridine2552-2'-O)-methyltransferase